MLEIDYTSIESAQCVTYMSNKSIILDVEMFYGRMLLNSSPYWNILTDIFKRYFQESDLYQIITSSFHNNDDDARLYVKLHKTNNTYTIYFLLY